MPRDASSHQKCFRCGLPAGHWNEQHPGAGSDARPRISSVRDVTCVANWERRFQMISPETWEMTMGPNDRDPFIFRETSRSTGSIRLQSVHNRRLKAALNLGRQRIK